MKAIRRSLKGEKEPRANHISITPKSAIAIVPPKKVIKALFDYDPDPGNTHELKFCKGDFFHVISRENDPDWYEACNPLYPTARGLVPVSYFEIIGKNERQSAGSNTSAEQIKVDAHDSGFSDRSSHRRTDSSRSNTMPKSVTSVRSSGIGKGSGAMVYGIVMYDFNAERPDELDAKAGEAIIVIAQSNPEWFVAKPIGRLGGPGLIPVSFIELRDMTTGQAVQDPLDAVRRAGVPKVEEWKKMTAEYKNSSITLGKFDGAAANGANQMAAGMEKMSLNGNMQNGNGYAQQQQQQQAYQQHQRANSRGQLQSQPPPPQQYQQPQQQLLAPIAASIPRYCFDQDKYWYIIEAQMEDGSHWELSRYYHDFYDFQIALLGAFEEEAGTRGGPRTLPYMPGPVTHVTDAISNGRRQNLDEYIKKLLSMPPHISRCSLVRELFAPRPDDFEIDPNAINEDYRLSQGSHQSHSASGNEMSQPVSRQSSRGNIENGQMAGSYSSQHQSASYGGPQHQRQQSSMSMSQQGSPYHMMNRQVSNMTTTSATSAATANTTPTQTPTAPTNPPPSAGAMKIKVYCQDDLIAIRVPSSISFGQLKDKLRDRLNAPGDIMVQYKDEPTGSFAEIISDNDLDVAVQRNPKLQLHVSLL